MTNKNSNKSKGLNFNRKCERIPHAKDPNIFDVFLFLFFSLYGSPSAH